MTNPPPPTPPPHQPWQVPGGQLPTQPPPGHQHPAYPPYVVHAYPAPPQRLPAVPQEPVEYHHALRGPRRAWWRPLASLGLAVVGIVAAFIGMLITSGLAYLLLSGADIDAIGSMADDFNDPVTYGAQNLLLALLIPVAGLATWIAHGVRPGFVSSVLGRFRWGWFGWVLLVTVPLWLAYLTIATLIDDEGIGDTSGRPSSWIVLLVLTFVTIPLQSAGEEYLFRGWLMQQIGAWIKNTYAALALAILLSSVLFALAHTSLDPWVLIDLGAFATACVLLTWRTGGLEAAIAVHLVNNVILLSLMIVTTGLEDAFITPETTSDPVTTLTSVASLAVTTAVIWWLAHKRGVARRTIGWPASGTGAEVAR